MFCALWNSWMMPNIAQISNINELTVLASMTRDLFFGTVE